MTGEELGNLEGKKTHAAPKLRLAYLADCENLIVQRYVRYFAERGHDVHIFHCPLQERAFERPTPCSGVTLHPGLERPNTIGFIRKLLRARSLGRAIRTLHPDVVHLFNSRVSAQLAAASCQRPLVFTPWGADVLDNPFVRRRYYWRTRWLLQSVRGIAAASHAMIAHAKRFTGEVMSVHAQWGVDFSLFYDQRARRDAVRDALDLPRDSYVVFSPRQWGGKYNQDLILDALPRLRQSVPNAFLVFKFCITQGNLETRLRQRVQELGVQDYVRIFGPSTTTEESHQRMAELFQASDAFVSIPSWDGGTPVTVFEGMACGSIPVLSDIDTNCEYVRDRIEGRILKRLDAATLAGVLAEVHADREWRAKLRETLPDLARQACTYEVEMQRVLDFYRRIAQGERPAHARSRELASRGI